VNWLKEFTQEALRALVTLNSELLYEQLEWPQLTIDVDGTVVWTAAWVFRGYDVHDSRGRDPLRARADS
jgi:hypothetical protein